MRLYDIMENENYTEIEKIVSHFHKSVDVSGEIDPELRKSDVYKDVETIYNVKEYVSFLSKQKSKDEIWKNIRLKITPGRSFPIWLKYVAMIILSFSTGSLAVLFSGVNEKKATFGSITCPKGQITNLTLFDSTKVWLNSESTIKYASDFNESNREVYVEGEAYFEVIHNKKVPFVVNLRRSKVKVYGTSFNVKSYAGSSDVEVVLSKGKIEFITKKSSVILKPNEQIIFSAMQGTFTKSRIDTEKTLGWKDGKYFYSREKLGDIIDQMQRWYGVEIIPENEDILEYTFTGLIDKEKSIGYNLRSIEMTERIEVEYRSDKIVIRGKN